MHLLKLPDVIGGNAGKSFLFIGSGVGRRFRGPLGIVSTKRAAINCTQAYLAACGFNIYCGNVELDAAAIDANGT